jgi:hypothetical protein
VRITGDGLLSSAGVCSGYGIGQVLTNEEFSMSGHAIHIKVDGRTYSGTYTVDRKILTVTTTYGRKSAEIAPKVTHETLAHQLL